MTERSFGSGGSEDDEYNGLPVPNRDEFQKPGDDYCGKTKPLTQEQKDWLLTIDVPFSAHEHDFLQNDSRVNDFVLGVVQDKYMPNDRDEDGNLLDDYITRATTAISDATKLLLGDEQGTEPGETERAAYAIIRRWLIEADRERSAMYYGMASEGVYFPLYDEDDLSAELVEALTPSRNRTITHAADAVGLLYVKMCTQKVAIMWESLEEDVESEDGNTTSDTLVEEEVLERIARPKLTLREFGAHMVDVAKLAAGVSAGIVIGSLFSEKRHYKK